MSFWKKLFERKHTRTDGIVFVISFVLIVFMELLTRPLWLKDLLLGIWLIGVVGYLGYMFWYKKSSCGYCLALFIWLIITSIMLVYEWVRD